MSKKLLLSKFILKKIIKADILGIYETHGRNVWKYQEVIGSRKLKTDKQYNGQMKKSTKWQTMIYKTLLRKLKFEQLEPPQKKNHNKNRGWNQMLQKDK